MKRILVLEDEAIVMNLMRFMLKKYSLIEASTVDQARTLFHDHREDVGLLLADVTLPVSSDLELALLIRQESPFLPIILTSGYPVCAWSTADGRNLLRLGAASVKVLQKPFHRQLLLATISDSMGQGSDLLQDTPAGNGVEVPAEPHL